MGTTNTNQTGATKQHKFIDVDVFQTHFGIMSERAVLAIYAEKFGISQKNMKGIDFAICVNALRKLKDPDYVAPTNQSTKQVVTE